MAKDRGGGGRGGEGGGWEAHITDRADSGGSALD